MLLLLTQTIAFGGGPRPNDDVQVVTGAPPTSFTEFARRTGGGLGRAGSGMNSVGHLDDFRALEPVLSHRPRRRSLDSPTGTLPSGGLSAHPQAFVNGFQHAMLAATIIAAAGAAGTAMLLIPDPRPGPISHTVEQELPQFVGEK